MCIIIIKDVFYSFADKLKKHFEIPECPCHVEELGMRMDRSTPI